MSIRFLRFSTSGLNMGGILTYPGLLRTLDTSFFAGLLT